MKTKKTTKNIGKQKSIVKDTNKIVLEFDNPLNTNSNDFVEQKEDLENLPDTFSDISNFTPLDNLETPNSNFPSVNIPKKTSFGGLGKKIKGIFHKKSSATKLSSQDQRGSMTEMEQLEFEFQQKKLLLKKKQEQEIEQRIREREKFIQEQKKLLKQEKPTIIPSRTMGIEGKGFIKDQINIELIPHDMEIQNYCAKCGKKYKKGKIIRQGNVFIQEIKCKKCGNQFEKRIEI